MEYHEYKPHSHLSGYIECYWYAYSDRPPFRENESLIPDGTVELMFNFGENYFQVKDNEKVEVKGSHIIGIRKKSLTISQTGKQHFFCIRFRLGGTYPFFKLPVYLFANEFYTLTELFDNQLNELEEKLYCARDNQTRVLLTDEYLLKKLQYQNEDFLFTVKCMPIILRSGSVSKTAGDLNVNYKMLERRFKKVFGISPSELIKINRFNNAVLSMYSCKHPTLTSIAHSCGYFDQSHFIREFKQLTNFTPKEFLKEQFTIVQVIQPALAERMSKSYNF